MEVTKLFSYRKATVLRDVVETPDTKTFTLAVEGIYSAEPGQFNMVYMWGLGEVPISVSGLPRKLGDFTVIDHTIRVVGAVTRGIVKSVSIGSVLGVRGPYGRGWPLRESENLDIVVVAGGIGLAPLRPAIQFVLENRDKYGELVVLYGARTPSLLLYKDELKGYGREDRLRLLVSVDMAEGFIPDVPINYQGFVTDLIQHININPKNAAAFVCGPEVMIKTACRKLVERGFSKERIYVSLERRMRCGIGICGTCQLGHYFMCRDGPVFSIQEVEDYLAVEGL
ncbi:MAG: FAD/NAD(P)-binding protein [Desulfurococcaceae archaeon]